MKYAIYTLYLLKREDLVTPIQINEDYVFNFGGLPWEDEITGDHYDEGRLSDTIWDNYDWWSGLDGTVVTVISTMNVRTANGCKTLVKVHVKDQDHTWWFTADGKELSPVGNTTKNPSGGCSCDISALMVRGCRCGGS